MPDYLLGIIIFCIGVFLGYWLPQKIVAAIIERLVAREMRDVDFPFHTLNTFSLRTFLSDVEPRVYPYLSGRLLSKVNDRLRKDHAFMIETATQGIASDDKMIAYLEKTGSG